MAYTTIDDPSAHFHTQLYTGNRSSTQTITNDANAGDFKPDWVWIKQRNDTVAHSHNLIDSSRGVTKHMYSNTTDAEQTISNGLTSFNTDGFSIANNPALNQPDRDVNYVAWQWKANGGTTSSDSNGSITSTVQANTNAGFSIVTYTGNATSGATVGHGLGKAPSWYICKRRSNTGHWEVYHEGNTSAPQTEHIRLSATSATEDSNEYWNDTAPTSSVFSLGNHVNVNENANTYVAYCFAEIKGYSKFGKYTGNGSQNGTFVYTGFKPAWIMAKRTDAAKNWYIADSARSPNNVNKAHLVANSSDAEDTSGDATDSYFDILSNGFKLRQDFSHLNASGAEHIYMAFAEHPFVSSKGVPVTAI